MFLKIEDLPNVIYDYQLDQITEGNENITLQALAAAEEELRSYLTMNNKKEWSDGRLKYDLDAIFTSEGENRNALLLSHGVTIAKWHIAELCNADFIYEKAKDRYDRSIDWLKQLRDGDVSLSSLPTLSEDASLNENSTQPFMFGSRTKFNHE